MVAPFRRLRQPGPTGPQGCATDGEEKLVAVATAFGLCLTLIADVAVAQQPGNHIRNRGNPELFLNDENGVPTAEPIQPGTPSAQWELELVSDELLMRIKNVASGAYLNTDNGALALGDAAAGNPSAEWQVEPIEGTSFVRFRNAASDLYLGLQEVDGPLGVLSLDPTVAPQPGAAADTAPAVAEWEFIVATGIPLIAAPPVPIQTLIPLEPSYAPRIRACGGGRIYYRGACRCPIEAVDEGGSAACRISTASAARSFVCSACVRVDACRSRPAGAS